PRRPRRPHPICLSCREKLVFSIGLNVSEASRMLFVFTRNRYGRGVSHAALALLVVAALSRCSWEESRELRQWTKILSQHRAGQPTPIHTPLHDCDRESGCICRGATVVQAVNTTDVADMQADWLSIDLAAVMVWLNPTTGASHGGPILDEALHLPRISGRQ